jgi:hypothetical protein
MDILTHTVCGLAVGGLVAGIVSKETVRRKEKYRGGAHVSRRLKIVLAGVAGGAFPDIDAVSLWSKFDETAGKWFGLHHSGSEIYSGKLWYSHHAFFHSVSAALLAGCVIAGVLFLLRQPAYGSFRKFVRHQYPAYIAFVAAYVAHLLCDCITPGSVWGGVRMFFPLQMYIGGWGNVWWWNNYDIFLILFLCSMLNLTWLIIFLRKSIRARIVPVTITLAAFAWMTVQISCRRTDYAYEGHTAHYAKMETASKAEQQRILGTKLYRLMEKFDNTLPFFF